jgi:hypothetical protein
MATKTRPKVDNKRQSQTHKSPTPEEVVSSIRKNFRDNVKPALDEWNKDVRIIRYR